MSTRNLRGNDGVGQRVENTGARRDADEAVREGVFEYVDEVGEREAALAPSVELEVQARIDASNTRGGLTLAEEERVLGRNWEVARTRHRADARQESSREARNREYVSARTPSELWEAREADPREGLGCELLGVVNQEAQRLESRCSGVSRAALSRVLAGRLRVHGDVTRGVLETLECFVHGRGQVIPIGELECVNHSEVSVRGEVVRLFEASHPAIAQAGLLEDASGVLKFTVWEKSQQPHVAEGEHVHFGGVALNSYEGRSSVAVTGWSIIRVLNQERYWEP